MSETKIVSEEELWQYVVRHVEEGYTDNLLDGLGETMDGPRISFMKVKNNPEADHIFREFNQEICFYAEYIENNPPSNVILADIIFRVIKKLHENKIFFSKKASIVQPLQKIYEKDFVLRKEDDPPLRHCKHCRKLIREPGDKQKYCNSRCELLAQYKRRGRDPIEIHTHCIQCGNPLTKRAGAKYCSPACNMAYRRKKVKDYSSLPEPSALP
jgi:predicted nucleic acid-binding Zn ribbon protein